MTLFGCLSFGLQMLLWRVTIGLALSMATISPATARGAMCGASCANWIYPLIAFVALSGVTIMGAYYLALTVMPHGRAWVDMKRGRLKNGATGVTLVLIGGGGLALMFQMYIHI